MPLLELMGDRDLGLISLDKARWHTWCRSRCWWRTQKLAVANLKHLVNLVLVYQLTPGVVVHQQTVAPGAIGAVVQQAQGLVVPVNLDTAHFETTIWHM